MSFSDSFLIQTKFNAHPRFFVETGARHGNISHSHVIDWLHRFGNTSLLLQTEQHYQGTHYPAAQLGYQHMHKEARLSTHKIKTNAIFGSLGS